MLLVVPEKNHEEHIAPQIYSIIRNYASGLYVNEPHVKHFFGHRKAISMCSLMWENYKFSLREILVKFNWIPFQISDMLI